MNPSTITDAALLTLQQMSGFVPETLLTTFVSLMITYLLVAKGFTWPDRKARGGCPTPSSPPRWLRLARC